MPYVYNGEKISLRSTIRWQGFAYHIEKSQLHKGSLISKQKHPLKQVEEFKRKLFQKNKLQDRGDHYILKKTISVGYVMALNLHYGKFVNTQNSKLNKAKNDYLTAIKPSTINELKLGNISACGAPLHKSYFQDSLILEELIEVEINFNVISKHNGDKFSTIEKLFYDTAIDMGLISKESRHGISLQHECDIVDEVNGIQIEVITEFKNRFPKDKIPHKNLGAMSLELVGNNFIHTSSAMSDKYYKKTYTSKYAKILAIYCIGNESAVEGMLKSIIKDIDNKGKTKNKFENVWIIYNDFIRNKTFFMYSIKNHVPIKKEIKTNVGILSRKRHASLKELNKTGSYYVYAKSIFNKNDTITGVLEGYEIQKLANRLHIAS